MEKIYFENDDARLMRVGELFVAEWRGTIHESYVEQLEAGIVELAEESKGRIPMLVVIREGSPLPESGVRNAMHESLARTGSRIAAMASFIEGEGVRGFTVRAIFNAMRVLSRTPHPHRAFATLEESLAWLRTQTSDPSGWTAERVRAALSAAR